eukprot:COSAG02_NODE_17324_length_1012_cov_1.250821_2_plen_133_part_01
MPAVYKIDVMPDKEAEDMPVLPGSSQDAAPKDLATLTSDVARLEALMQEQQLRAELLNRAVGVPKPGASIWEKGRLAVTNQVNAKLARFGPNRGFLIATLVLLCNLTFIFVFVTSKANSCTQTSAIMDPEPTV